MEKIRFGIIGAGMAGPYFGDAISQIPGASITAVATRTGASGAAFAQKYGVPVSYTDWRQVVTHPEVDAVCVLTPPADHVEMVIAAARAGKHVITEKPVARNLEETDRMIAACDQAGVRFGVIFMYRFMDTALQMKEVVDQGLLGRLIAAECECKFYRTQAYYDMAPWRGTWAGEGGGCLMSQLIHTIDLMIWIMGDVRSLSAYYDTAAHNIEVDDVVTASLRFKNGALGTIHGGTSYKPGYPRRLEIHGERGSIALRDDNISIWDVEGMEGANYLTQPKKDLGNTYSSAGYADATNHRRQLMDFIVAIREGRPPLVDGREGRRALEVVRAIYQSGDLGARVDFPINEDPSFGRPPAARS